jgi:hypothetical protein
MKTSRYILLLIAFLLVALAMQDCRSRKQSAGESELEQTEVVDTAEARIVSGSNEQSPVIRNELIIEFREGVNMDAFTERHLEAGFELAKPLNPTQTLWLARFDTLMLSPDEMLGRLKEDRDIVTIEFNKRIGLRR